LLTCLPSARRLARPTSRWAKAMRTKSSDKPA